MPESDLDSVIRQAAKAQHKAVMTAVKKRHDQHMARAAKAKDKDTRAHHRMLAKNTMLHGAAAARRLQNSAHNTADSYARAIRQAAETPPAKKPRKKKSA